jgi:hypothetical protein
MARAEVLVTLPPRGGAQAPTATTVDTVNGHYFQNPDGRELLIVKNGDASSHNFTIHNPTTVEGLTVPDRVIAIPAGQTFWIPGPSPQVFDQPGTVVVSFDADFAMTVQVARLPQ